MPSSSPRLPSSLSLCLGLCLPTVLFLVGGCHSLARGSGGADSPWWEAHTPAASDTAVVERATPPPDTLAPRGVAAVRPAAAGTPSTAIDTATVTPEQWAARREAYDRRTDEDRRRVRQVNEYVYWCLEQGLWDEARIHLEQALATDSLAASLHNNLGIVHERSGRHEAARRHYRMAAELNPERALYAVNLQRLRASLERPRRAAESDSLGQDELLMPPPRGDRRPDLGVTPTPTRERGMADERADRDS